MIGDLVSMAWLALVGWGLRGWWDERKKVPLSFGDQLLVDMLASVDGERERWALGEGWKVTTRRTVNWGGRRLVVAMAEAKEGTDNG